MIADDLATAIEQHTEELRQREVAIREYFDRYHELTNRAIDEAVMWRRRFFFACGAIIGIGLAHLLQLAA